MASLRPQGRARGEVLLSFFNQPFLLRRGQPVPITHQHHWESLLMGRMFLELGYAVDVIHYANQAFVPRKPYAIVVDARRNMERFAAALPGSTKIMHIDTAHILFHNAAEAARLLALQQRRGVTLRPRRWEMPTLAIEAADCATIYGNAQTMATYAYAGKPLYPVPTISPLTYPWPEEKSYEAARRRYLFLSSGGMVHKGLDLVLEAFAAMPEYHLTVCAPVGAEGDFERAYRRELYESPNIQTLGWVDVGSDDFVALTSRCVGLIYPSCSEGQAGAVVTCMHAGLIPVMSAASGVTPSDFGVLLPTCTVQGIRETVAALSALPAGELQARSRLAWEAARREHTREAFARAFRAALLVITGEPAPTEEPALRVALRV
ncbi:MAG: glycosyltransferase [bacterium]